MLNFQDYKRMVGYGATTTGSTHTAEAKSVIEASWYDDPASCIGYLYSWEYDDEQDKNIGLHPEKSKTKIPVDVKFLINSYQSLDRDNIDYRIMFKPSYKCNVPYYENLFAKKCGAEWPVGLFIDLPDSEGIYRRWLIVAGANTDNRDFPNWAVLFCDYDFKWVHKGKKMHLWGVGRSQNSYNSGQWTDHYFTTIENQRKLILPYNDVSKTIFYNLRIGITPPLDTPVMWKISKVEGVNPLGVIYYTVVQDLYNPNTDVIDYDNDGNWIGVYADLKGDGNLPTIETSDPEVLPLATIGDYAELTYSGTKPQLKVKGGYKAITIAYYNSGQLLKNQTPGDWSFIIDNTDVSDLITKLDTDDPNKIKIKFLGDEHYLHKVLTVKNTREGITAEIKFEIIGL